MAGLSGQPRFRAEQTPFTVHPKAQMPRHLLIYGNTQKTLVDGFVSIGKYNRHARNYTIPFGMEDENGEILYCDFDIPCPLCRIPGHAVDELDAVRGQVISRTATVTFSTLSEQVSIEAWVNGRAIYAIPLSPRAAARPTAVFSNGLTPCESLGEVAARDFSCMLAEDGSRLIFMLSDETNSLEQIKSNLRMTDLVAVYARDVEEIIRFDPYMPPMPSPVCRVMMYDGLQTDVELSYDPILQGG